MAKQLEELVTIYHGCDFALLVDAVTKRSILSASRTRAEQVRVDRVSSPYYLNEDIITKMGSRGFKKYWNDMVINVHDYVKRHKKWLLEHGSEKTKFLLENWKDFGEFVKKRIKGTKFFKRNCIWASKSEQDARYLGSHGYLELKVPKKNIYFGAMGDWGIVPGQLPLTYATKLKVFDYEDQGALEIYLMMAGLDNLKVELVS